MITLRHAARSAIVAAAVAAMLSGCSGTTPSSDPTGATTTTAADAPAGDGACPKLTSDELATLGYGVQILTQLQGQDQVNAVNDGTIAFDPAAFGAVLDRLESLRGHPSEGFADPGDAIDVLRSVNDKAVAMLAVDGDVPQAMFDDYAAVAGPVGDLLGQQAPITLALDDACG